MPKSASSQYLLVGIIIVLSTVVGVKLHSYIGFGFTLVYPPVIAFIAAKFGQQPARMGIVACIFSYWLFVLRQSYSFIDIQTQEAMFLASLAAILVVIEELTSRLRSTNLLLTEKTLALEEANRKLRNTMRQREDFMAAISHDLKSPLIGCGRLLEILNGKNKNTSDDTIFRQLITSNKRMQRMVWNILDCYRSEEGALRPAVEMIEVADLVRQCRDDIDYILSMKTQKLQITVFGADRYMVRVDPLLLKRAMVNLLENAARHSPAGSEIGVFISVAGDFITLAVKDAGPGVPMENRKNLFKRFCSDDESKKTGGTGLGLYVISTIAAAHAGSISYQGPEDGGRSTFSLELPYCAKDNVWNGFVDVRPEQLLTDPSMFKIDPPAAGRLG